VFRLLRDDEGAQTVAHQDLRGRTSAEPGAGGEPAPAACLSLRGTVLADRYRLTEPLGCGGVADVYRGVDESLGRAVAVKVFRPEAGPELGEQRRFEQEGRTLAALQHPNLVTLYDAGVEYDRAYLVLQLVDGDTLGERLRHGPLVPAEAARIGAALADALGCAHTHKVVHRDVKPSNVLLDGHGGVYLTDFGIARMIDAPAITATGLLVGTAAYLAPEQVTGQGAEPASDVYALGLVLLECLTGRRVYQGGVAEVALARLTNPPQVPENLGARWHALLTAMTAREPADRPGTDTVTAQLRWLAEHPDGDPAGDAGEALPRLAAPAAAAAAGAAGGASGRDPGEDTLAVPAAGLVAGATAAAPATAAGPAAAVTAGFPGPGVQGRGPGPAPPDRPGGRTRVLAAVASAILLAAAAVTFLVLRPPPDGQARQPGGGPGVSQSPKTKAPAQQGGNPGTGGTAAVQEESTPSPRTSSATRSQAPGGTGSPESRPGGSVPSRRPSGSPTGAEPTPTPTPSDSGTEDETDPSQDATEPADGGGQDGDGAKAKQKKVKVKKKDAAVTV
jgi:eukaryotic-like serine/threonine-protein kinase